MSIQASILAAILPVAVYLFFLWRADRFEKESFPDLLLHFFWGALGAVVLSLLAGKAYSYFLEFLIPRGNKLFFIESVYMAPLFEELSKAAFLIYTVRSKKIDNVTDGLIYGASIGLGFGMVENFFYFLLYDSAVWDWISVVLLRSFFSAVMHTVASAAVGALVAKAIFNPSRKSVFFFFGGLILASFIHFIWNLSISFEYSYYLGILFMLILTVLFVVYFRKQIAEERKTILTELQEECEEGLIPYHHLPILSSGLKDKKGWVKEEIRTNYTETAIKLAYRKKQLKNSGNKSPFYQKEVAYYKSKLMELSTQFEN